MYLLVYKMNFLKSHIFGNNPMFFRWIKSMYKYIWHRHVLVPPAALKDCFILAIYKETLLSSGGWETHAIAPGECGGLFLSCLPKMEWDRGVHSCLFIRTFTPIKRAVPSWLSLSKLLLYYPISHWEFNVRISGEHTHSGHRNNPYGLKLFFYRLEMLFQEKGADEVPVRMHVKE